jgi:hypothetical protein
VTPGSPQECGSRFEDLLSVITLSDLADVQYTKTLEEEKERKEGEKPAVVFLFHGDKVYSAAG